MKKVVFTSDKLVNGSLMYAKGVVCEIDEKSLSRWLKRGAIEISKLTVGKSVLNDKGEMPSYEDLLVMDQGKKKVIIEKDVKKTVKEDVKEIEEVVVADMMSEEKVQKPKRGGKRTVK